MSERVRFRKWLLTLFCTKATGFSKKSGLKALKESFSKFKVLVISPYHDKDDSEPHYHVILQDDLQIDFNKIKKLIPVIHCEPQRSNNITAYRYLYHDTKDSKDKYQYDKDEIWSNMNNDLFLLWLGNNDKKQDSRDVGLDIMATIEESRSIWDVLKAYPEYWRDVGRIKELYYLYKVHKFYEDNGWECDIDMVQDKDNTALSVSLSAANKPLKKDIDDVL